MIDSRERQYLEQARLFANITLESVQHLLEGCDRLNLERGDHLLEAGAANSAAPRAEAGPAFSWCDSTRT